MPKETHVSIEEVISLLEAMHLVWMKVGEWQNPHVKKVRDNIWRAHRPPFVYEIRLYEAGEKNSVATITIKRGEDVLWRERTRDMKSVKAIMEGRQATPHQELVRALLSMG